MYILPALKTPSLTVWKSLLCHAHSPLTTRRLCLCAPPLLSDNETEPRLQAWFHQDGDSGAPFRTITRVKSSNRLCLRTTPRVKLTNTRRLRLLTSAPFGCFKSVLPRHAHSPLTTRRLRLLTSAPFGCFKSVLSRHAHSPLTTSRFRLFTSVTVKSVDAAPPFGQHPL
jgi:hypothetical protein